MWRFDLKLDTDDDFRLFDNNQFTEWGSSEELLKASVMYWLNSPIIRYMKNWAILEDDVVVKSGDYSEQMMELLSMVKNSLKKSKENLVEKTHGNYGFQYSIVDCGAGKS